MEKIQPCLWFDHEAEEAANFYTSVFANAEIHRVVPYGRAASQASGQAEGSVMTVEFELEGLRLLGLNGGPHFKLNPSLSFFVGCNSEQEIEELWGRLSKEVRMELMKYPFAEKYGWCEDRFTINWQLILAPRRQKMVPALLFANERYGKAEEAIRFYVSQFPGSRVEMIARDEQTKGVLHGVFTLAGQDFVIVESPLKHEFGFSPAMSFIVNCDSQEEIDDIWARLSAVPEAERCGWLQDKYGVSWQVVHKDWGKMIFDADSAGRERLMGAILGMKKPDLKKLQQALQ